LLSKLENSDNEERNQTKERFFSRIIAIIIILLRENDVK
jgi:hypothetical protein